MHHSSIGGEMANLAIGRTRLAAAALAALALVLGAIALAQAAKPKAVVSYPNFKKTTGLKLNGDAAREGKVLRLTPAEGDKIGTAFTKRKAVQTAKSFKAQFRYSLHDGSLAPGDGMAFVLQSRSAGATGNGGGGVGYSGITRSIAIEFDTFQNPEANDPSNNYVGLLVNGNTGKHLEAETPDAGVYGAPRSVWVDYSAKRKKLKVFFSDGSKKPKKPLFSHKLNLENVIEGKSARAGFTSSTGGSFQAADVLKLKIEQ
jgi:hypothetical protein